MYILLIGVIINASITVSISMPCDKGWLEYEGKCFKHYNTAVTWDSAKGTCDLLRKAQLATVDSPNINTFIHNLTRDSDVWIGLSISDISKSRWKWSDGGNTSTYDDWTMADVNSACAVMKYGNSEGYWYTSPCTTTTTYICEKEMPDDNCSDWLRLDTHCYLIIREHEETHMAAARSCWQYGGYLISINSRQEAGFIYSYIEINMEYWIGLSPLKWVIGAPYQWNNWYEKGPTYSILNGCVYINATSGKWFSENCDNAFLPGLHHTYICQKDAVIDFSTISNVAIEEDTSTNTVLGELQTTESDTLNISNRQSFKDNSKHLLLTTVILAVCVGLVVIIVVIVVIIVIRQRRRRLASQDAKPKEQAIYYNDIKKTTDNGMVKRTDTNPTKTNETKQHVQTKDSNTPSAGDTERNTYEQLSVGPYVNSGQIQAGTYASLQ